MEAEGLLATLSLVADPSKRADPSYMGHMLNDGATCADEALRSQYVVAANAARNVEQAMLEGCHMAIVTTRDVTRGEELFLSYGAFYWIKRLGPRGTQAAGDLPISPRDGCGGDVEGDPRGNPRRNRRKRPTSRHTTPRGVLNTP